mmetsp:Transcript_15791/g.35369  ORF Transcript_15791/g.35369 Transcript_15791/m.35369 type:complete len:219 (-) Transcript_15791:530-1186(-)
MAAAAAASPADCTALAAPMPDKLAAAARSRPSGIVGRVLSAARPVAELREDQSIEASLIASRPLKTVVTFTSFSSLLRFLQSTSTSNLMVSFRSAIGCSSARIPSTIMVQGFGGRKMRELAHDSMILAMKGMMAMSRPLSNASRMSALKSKSFCRIGLFFPRVSAPSHDPRFFRRERSEEDVRILSSTSRILMFSIVMSTMFFRRWRHRFSSRSASWM